MKWFKNKDGKDNKEPESQAVTKSLLIFPDTSTVMHVEQILKEEEYDTRLVSPPQQYRTGCDLSIEVPMIDVPEITSMLKKIGLAPIDVLPITGKESKPLRLYKTSDLGDFIMVRAANMKLTIEKSTTRIVNISGGGCPDVPYLATQMVGKLLSEAPEPSVVGFSLCAYSLNMAYEELMKMVGGE